MYPSVNPDDKRIFCQKVLLLLTYLEKTVMLVIYLKNIFKRKLLLEVSIYLYIVVAGKGLNMIIQALGPDSINNNNVKRFSKV